MDKLTQYDTHIFLGPTLSLNDARSIFANAHYHYPIQCGDLLRLLRLKPRRVLIIDGCYEFTPAVWHKEIMLALDLGIEVYGASSMGALRASELSMVGMKGLGVICQLFESGDLNDDDEVAVLHKSAEEGFEPINDAMVNIRQTLLRAVEKDIIDERSKQTLLKYCKQLFYPNRNLSSAIDKVELSSSEMASNLKTWLYKEGVIDLKRHDAILALNHLKNCSDKQNTRCSEIKPMPVTKFINHLIDYGFATPFQKEYSWLPNHEKAMIQFEKREPEWFRLLSDLAIFLKNMALISEVDIKSVDEKEIADYRSENQLYFYEKDWYPLINKAHYSELMSYINQQVCLAGLTEEMVRGMIPAAKIFYQLESSEVIGSLRPLVCLLLLIEYQMQTANITLKKDSFLRGVGKMARVRGYNRDETIRWLSSDTDSNQLLTLLTVRQKINCLHQGIGDLLLRHERDTPQYFNWLFDAAMLCGIDVEQLMLNAEEVCA